MADKKILACVVTLSVFLVVYSTTSVVLCGDGSCELDNGKTQTDDGKVASRTSLSLDSSLQSKATTQRSFLAVVPIRSASAKSKFTKNTTLPQNTKIAKGITNVKSKQDKPQDSSDPHSCQDNSFSNNLPLTALASFPGAGNTWARHIIEQATGIYTGSVYEPVLRDVGFLGDGVHDGSVVVIKTHRLPTGTNAPDYKRCILLLRDPGDAMIAEFKRLKAGKTGTPSLALFKTPDWKHFVGEKMIQFEIFYRTWLSELFQGQKYILRYEDLIKDLKATVKPLVKVLLGTDVTKNALNCLEDNAEGDYHRAPADFTREDIFTSDQEMMLTIIKKRVNSRINDCVKRGPCLEIVQQ
ncbi:hypothetical protein CAPTEDRAFT_199613 [Capitella teleta]|uniref:Sulfotransferase domain-containing protein n=1 Tax=Capitella teleta TaxID=283909 RepID=R7U922_CAPTE|nr:hypothetical protein CAPTEDRAFT_199613 [Capitella teleta]|eukprot:ELU02641.1 hypothetical protein CAPTEDRAFT_199613 [Capitella teleta]